jgi:hypothetical protein
MPPLAEGPISIARNLGLFLIKRRNLDLRLMNEKVKLAPANLTEAGLDNDSDFQQSCSRHEANWIPLDCRFESGRFGFITKV